MSYDLQVKIHPEYVYFKRTGTAVYSEVLESWAKVIQVCNEHGIKKVLAETVNEIYLPAKEVFDVATRFQELSADYGFRIAHVFTGTEPESLGGRFGESVLRKRGTNYRKFDDIESAKEWLLLD